MATGLATLGAAGAAVGALWFTNQSLRATNNQYALSQQIAATDRFRLATEQLASDKVDVRLSGIYLLERLATDSPADHPTIFAVLAAFVRTHAPAAECAAGPPQRVPKPAWIRVEGRIRPEGLPTSAPSDIQAALAVIGRRNTTIENTETRLDLRYTCLRGTDLADMNLARTNLIGANLTGANLIGTDLSGALLTAADLTWAIGAGANLTDALLAFANLESANLGGATLDRTNLSGANLTGTFLGITDLTSTKLIDVHYGGSTKWPDGFTPPQPSTP
jgi:hypothetical protein